MTDTYPEGDPFADAPWSAVAPENQAQIVADLRHRYEGAVDLFDGTPPVEGDPFAEPLHDPATGELLEPETRIGDLGHVGPDGRILNDSAHARALAVAGTQPYTGEQITPLDLLPQHMADDTAQAVAFPERGQLAEFAGNLSRALDDRVNALYNAAQQRRPAGPVTQTTISGEVTTLAAISDLGKTLGDVFARMDKGARSLLGDVLAELPRAAEVEKRGGSMSVRVGVRAGEDVKATLTQPTETFTDTPGIVDVLVAALVARRAAERGNATAVELQEHANGARMMAAALLEGVDGQPGLLASPKWKSTALDALRADLERSAEPGLAGRLDAAYGRRPVGNVQTKVERVEPPRRGQRTIDGPA